MSRRRFGRYDGSLQMFCDEPKPIDLNRLGFLRYLAEQGKLEHAVAGPPSGPLVDAVAPAPEYSGRAA